MNRTVIPNKHSVSAVTYFSEWLCLRMVEQNINAVALANSVGVDRKTIYAFCSGKRYPKLDVLAKIFHYLGEDKIEIPMEVDDL